MTTLLQQLQMSFDAENTTAGSLGGWNEKIQQQLERDPLPQLQQQQQQQKGRDSFQVQQQQQREREPLQLQQQQQQRERDSLQLQQQRERDPLQLQPQRERDPLQLQQQMERDPLKMHQQREQLQIHQRERERDRERDQIRDREQLVHREKMQMHHISQLQSINNILLDLPPASKASYPFARDYEALPYNQPNAKGSNEDDVPLYDLLGLCLPRGSLMEGQSSVDSPLSRQQHHGQSHGHNPPHLNYAQYNDGHGCYSNSSWNTDMPSTPGSVTTPGSPSTPGSVYSNCYSYSSGGNSTGCVTPSPTNRSHHNPGSPTSPGNSPYYGRPIRGSPAYSDCSSPSADCPPMFGFGGSRSNSPADSETSGYSSVDGSMSDMIARNCQSLNSSGHSWYPQSMNSFPNTDLDPYHGSNRGSAYQRMAIKKIQQQQQHSNMRHHHCCSTGNKCLPINKLPNLMVEPNMSLDRAAKFHRNAAALSEATCTWVGELPKRTVKSSGFSSKVFLGGVPWDVTESLLISTFKQFGQIRVEWPGKEDSQPKGYAYIIFESEKQVKALLASCTHNFGDERTYYRITPKRSKPKDVQVIPWHISDSNYSKSSSQKLDPEKTVFVGALHGMLTAETLANIMNDLFEEVIYAGIDTDRYKYPMGSARVTFSNKRSYKKACATAFVEIKTDKFTKKVQIDPYIEDSVCSGCAVQRGPYFCREPICSRYFCLGCWHWQHALEPMRHHLPMSRDSKTKAIVPYGYKFPPRENRLQPLGFNGDMFF